MKIHSSLGAFFLRIAFGVFPGFEFGQNITVVLN